MKLLATKNTYSGSNNELNIKHHNNIIEITAHSYSWWQYIYTDSVGNIILNDTNYSNSTSVHQSNSYHIMRRLGITPNITIYDNKNQSNSNSEEFLKESIKNLGKQIKNLRMGINKKGSWKKTNIDRKKNIKYLIFKIKDLQNFTYNYYNKKLWPINNTNKNNYNIHNLNETKSYEKYFKKSNGKIKINELNDFLKNKTHRNNAPNSIDKITKLLNIKKNDQENITTILNYSFSNDLNNMIFSENSIEYLSLLKTLKRYKISKKELNTLDLDKIHNFITNKINKKKYTPSEPVKFHLNKEIMELENKIEPKHLTLIKTDEELRKEGKKQNHCIGTRYYINKCLSGFQAFNYKNYTFFLSPENKIISTHGKHNSATPQIIINEINKALKAS